MSQLRSLAHKLLTESECAELKSAIQCFKKDKSVLLLCASLYKILSTPEKMQILLAVYPMIPPELQKDFDSLCSLQFDYYATTLRPKIAEKYDKKAKGKHKAKESAKSSALLSVDQIRRFHTPRGNSKHDGIKSSDDEKVMAAASKGSRKSKELRHRRSPEQTRRHVRGAQQQRKRSKTAHAVLGSAKVHSLQRQQEGQSPRVAPPRVPPLELEISNNSSNTSMNSTLQPAAQHTPQNIPIRKVKLERRRGQSLGFAIRGGSDLKSGIYVSEVDAGGQAERRGLKIGERILKVNDVTFKNVSHSEAVAALTASRKVTIYVANVGLMPGSTPRSVGTSRSAGTPREINTSRSEDTNKLSARSQEGSPRDAVKKLTVFADDDNYMGCSIRGGVDCGIDVMVAHVDPGSPAYKGGLKKGQCIIKVNDVSVDTLTHAQVISLITATTVVIFEVKPGSKDKPDNFRKQQKPNIAASSHTSNNISTGSPRDKQLNMEEFEKELMSTPPVSTSTPLPPEDHPLLLQNRPAEFNSNNHIDDASILHLLHSRRVSPQRNDSLNSEGATCSSHGSSTSDQNKTIKINNFDQNVKPSKFDKGTIKLNMAEKGQKDILKSAKIIDISIGNNPSKKDRRRSHVKDIFADNLKTPAGRSESCRSPPRHPITPQRERAQSMNVLSTPKYKHREIIHVTPPQDQLQAASKTAKMQIKQELTGKRLLLSPNVPVAPDSPVTNFFRKVLHTDSSGEKNLRKISSLESFGGNRGFEQSNAGISRWRSAYDFVTSDSDSDGD